MIIKVTDIPAEGRELSFKLPLELLNARVAESHSEGAEPRCVFVGAPSAALRLNLESSDVYIAGAVAAEYQTVCSRCAEATTKKIDAAVQLVLKPIAANVREAEHPSQRADDIDADLNFGFYSGGEVDCADAVLDFVFLALPYQEICTDTCKGLCPSCGTNLNVEPCSCKREREGDARFAVLRGLKIQ